MLEQRGLIRESLCLRKKAWLKILPTHATKSRRPNSPQRVCIFFPVVSSCHAPDRKTQRPGPQLPVSACPYSSAVCLCFSFQLEAITGAHTSALEERHRVPVWNPNYLTWHCFPTARTHGNEILMAQHCSSACRMAEGHHIWPQRPSLITLLSPSSLKINTITNI